MTDDETARLGLPVLQPGQAQKELYHNEALTLLDMLVQPSVGGAGIDTPPNAPEPGACWIVGDTPTGDWTGRAGAVACWTAGGWRFAAPREGMRLWVSTDRVHAVFDQGQWRLGETRARHLVIDDVPVVGPRGPEISDPEGGNVRDVEVRATLVALLDALRQHGLITTG